MKQILRTAALAATLMAAAGMAQAACYADYKAKRDNPLRLHYGVIQIDGPCAKDSAKRQVRKRLKGTGWTLLTVLGTFDESGLEERKASAGEHYLRY